MCIKPQTAESRQSRGITSATGNQKVVIWISAVNAFTQEKKGYSLALGGGGFLAFSAYTALIADDDLAGKMKDIDVISSSSGGSWFMACLAYSTKFAQIVESMGKNRTRVQDLFSKHFLDPFIGDSSKKKGAMDNSLVHFVQALFPNLVDAVKMVFAYGMEKKSEL